MTRWRGLVRITPDPKNEYPVGGLQSITSEQGDTPPPGFKFVELGEQEGDYYTQPVGKTWDPATEGYIDAPADNDPLSVADQEADVVIAKPRGSWTLADMETVVRDLALHLRPDQR